ncbi:MAG: hypothetical protein ACTSQI_22425 [Candidatus Helarchaeota archaeon]
MEENQRELTPEETEEILKDMRNLKIEVGKIEQYFKIREAHRSRRLVAAFRTILDALDLDVKKLES